MALLNPSKKLQSFNLIYTSITMFIFLIIAGANFFNAGRAGYNREVLLIYGFGAGLGALITLIFGAFSVFKLTKAKAMGIAISPQEVGFISESNPNIPLSNNIMTKLTPHIIWVVIILLVSTIFGFQVYPSPDIYGNVAEFSGSAGDISARNQFGIARSVFDVGISPGYTEDIVSLLMSAVFMLAIVFFTWILFFFTKNKFFKFNKLWLNVSIPFVTLLASIGLNFVSGFSQAHELVGGENIFFLISTVLFQWINLMIMWYTHLFLPLAHILHNTIFVLGFNVAFSVALLMTPIFEPKVFKNILITFKNGFVKNKKLHGGA